MVSPSNDIWFEGHLFVKISRFSDFYFTFNIFSHLTDVKHLTKFASDLGNHLGNILGTSRFFFLNGRNEIR